MPTKVGLVPTFLAASAAGVLWSKYSSYSYGYALSTIYAIVFPLFITYTAWLYPVYFSPLRNVPTVPGFPLWGHFLPIITEEIGIPQRRWHKEHGQIIRYYFPFGAERLSIAEDNALNHMCVRNPYNYPKPERARKWMIRILGEGVLLSEGKAHIQQRKALLPGFSIQSIRTLNPVFWSKALNLARLWQGEMKVANVDSKNFECLDWLNRTTLDIIGAAGFGTDINSLEHPDTPIREAYRLCFGFDIMSRVLHGLTAFFPAVKYLPAKMNRDVQNARRIILRLSTKIVKENEAATDSKKKDILSLIVRDNNKSQAAGEESLSFNTMRDQVMTFLGAGHDTTATGVAWTLHLLATHPDMQTRLRAEIKQYMPWLFDPNTRMDPSHLDADADQLPYLDNLCRESLRYIPPIPMTVRQTLADDTLGGYFVPAESTVYIHANAINRMPEYWGPTADNFDPDRWDNLPSTYTPNAYMTFLQGPRGCIGRKFAETEMKALLCCLLSLFEFAPDKSVQDPEELKMWRLVLRPRDGVSLKATLIAA